MWPCPGVLHHLAADYEARQVERDDEEVDGAVSDRLDRWGPNGDYFRSILHRWGSNGNYFGSILDRCGSNGNYFGSILGRCGSNGD